MTLLVNNRLEDEKMFEWNRSILILGTILCFVWRKLVKPQKFRIVSIRTEI
jgi:hypothetical protein